MKGMWQNLRKSLMENLPRNRRANSGRGDMARIAHGGLDKASIKSHESEPDLAILVNKFWEGSSSTERSRYSSSSDSESGLPDPQSLVESIKYLKQCVKQHESELLSTVHALIIDHMNEAEIKAANAGQCNASCVRCSLVRLLRKYGFDAALSWSKWVGARNVIVGDHEFIEVMIKSSNGSSERLIIEIDFRSHFQIARAAESNETLLSYVPVVYAGSLTKLDQCLQVMVKATEWSLKQNSMPFPQWRSLAYLRAKWLSTFERESYSSLQNSSMDYDPCVSYLKRLQTSLWSEIDMIHYFKNKHTLFRALMVAPSADVAVLSSSGG